jgi:regulator of cell morphogenesis and NO signaling
MTSRSPLAEAQTRRRAPASKWDSLPIRQLTDEIRRHHDFARSAFAHLRGPLENAVSAHVRERPELATIRKLFDELEADLLPHMMREERFIFPYIESIDAVSAGATAPRSAFGSVEAPARVMMIEHQHDEGILDLLSSLTDHFAPPSHASADLVELYGGLQLLVADL